MSQAIVHINNAKTIAIIIRVILREKYFTRNICFV
jgi:hypothetical protein